jgi:hypothetical protein
LLERGGNQRIELIFLETFGTGTTKMEIKELNSFFGDFWYSNNENGNQSIELIFFGDFWYSNIENLSIAFN